MKHKTTDDELDTIYSYINCLFKRGQFKIVDMLLVNLIIMVENPYHKTESLTKDKILAFLTCCRPARSKLNNYRFFFNNVKYLFTEDELRGLEPKE